MSREQWGHGYWKGVEDARAGRVNAKHTFKDEVKFWIAAMCQSNCSKSYDKTLFSVKEFISLCHFCGLSTKYAKKIYGFILDNNYYDFEPETQYLCYVSGSQQSDWQDDYFVIPYHYHTEEEWANIKDRLGELLDA